MKKVTYTCALLLVFLSGCGVSQPTIPDALEYREIPAAYLQECELPAAPLSNAELSDAFAQAYQCGEQGNRDKQRIKKLGKNSGGS